MMHDIKCARCSRGERCRFYWLILECLIRQATEARS